MTVSELPAVDAPGAELPVTPSPAGPNRRRRRLIRLLGAALSGALLALSFPPVGAWPLAFLGAGLLPLVVRGTRPRSAWVLATVSGLAYLTPTLSFTQFPGVDAWFALSLAEACIFGLVGPAYSAVQRLPYGLLWCPPVLIADEALRGRAPFGGFPWARLAFTQVNEPGVRWAAVGGAPLVSALVMATGCALAGLALVGWRRRAAHPRAVAGLAVAGIALPVLGLVVPVPTGGQPGAGGSSLTVAVVQGNVPRLGLDFDDQRRAVLDNHVNETLKLAAAVKAGTAVKPDIVIWPENSSDIDPFTQADGAAQLTRAATAIGVPILVGAVVDAGPTTVANEGLVWTSAGFTGQSYTKHHPVPFGEYVPFRAELTKLVGRLADNIPDDFIHGKGYAALDIGDTRIGDVICFEVAYDGLVRNSVQDGGRLLAVQTNNADFGFSSESAQQLDMVRLRAIEHGRAAVMASTTGISAIVEPDGRVVSQSKIFTPAVLESSLPLRSSTTLADRVGAWPEYVLTALGLLAWAGAIVSKRRRSASAR